MQVPNKMENQGALLLRSSTSRGAERRYRSPTLSSLFSLLLFFWNSVWFCVDLCLEIDSSFICGRRGLVESNDVWFFCIFVMWDLIWFVLRGRLEAIRVRFSLWIQHLGFVCSWIIEVLLLVSLCAESGRYGQASGRPVLDLRRLERGTRPGYQCCSRGEACLQGRWRSGPPTSTSTSSILCHCEHPHYSPFSVSSCI